VASGFCSSKREARPETSGAADQVPHPPAHAVAIGGAGTDRITSLGRSGGTKTEILEFELS
jgi:hypothetical protein